jgi:DNA-binding HxlR family transcriptional regulator
MLGNTYEGQNCSAARALEVVGERWSLLIVRDALFGGITRFADFQRSLGLARNILSSRLDRLVKAGLMERRQPEGSAYHEYHLTEKGEDLKPVVIALSHWGDRWAAPNGPPILYRHAGCGGHVEQQLVCSDCGQIVTKEQVGAHPGPGTTTADRHRAVRR